MNKPRIENSEFLKLIGAWKTEGRILAKDNEPEVNISGTDNYELILDGFFILHKADVLMGKNRGETFELISLDDATQATFSYYNNQSESGKMTGKLQNNRLTIEGDGLQFEGLLNDEGSQLTGVWRLADGQGQWVDWMEIRLSKVSLE
ncbi:MAG TPA: DUF1579 family protein [Cyclobacteriaceae bacterium]|nr:DUF1579 family protein [Cyclobacteriaceae bacterium]